MHTLSRATALSSILLSLVAGAQVPKPRVMIILDTSRSMMEYPNFASDAGVNVCPVCSDTAIPVSEATGGDYNMATNNNCTSKFCTAKKAVNQVLPNYTVDARIGLATYYQYIIKAESTNTQQTTCAYDVFSAPGIRKSFSSLTDFTGSGMTFCLGSAASSDAICTPGSTRTLSRFFPDSSASGGGAGLQGYCPLPTGATTPTSPTAAPTACSPGQPNCYVLTKTAAAPAMPVDCNIYSWPLPTLPKTFTSIANNGAGCQNGIPYSSVAPASAIVYRPPSPTRIEQIVAPATVSCPPAVPTTTNPGATPPSVTLTAAPTIGSAVGNWRNFSGPGEQCSAETPCSFFSYSSTPVDRFGSSAWYGFFSNTFTPAATLLSSTGTYQFNQFNAGSYPYTANVLSGNVTLENGTACQGGGWPLGTGVGTTTRYTSGSLGGFGIANPMLTLDGTPGVTRSGRAEHTPTRTVTNDYNCTPGYPCDVRLSADVSVVSNLGVIYANVATPPEYTTALAAASVSLRLLAPATTCPSLASNSSSTNVPANAVWTAVPAGCTGSGTGNCVFSAPSAPTTVTASAGTCNNVTRWTDNPSTLPANCSFNNKAYTLLGTAPFSVTSTVVNPATCATGTIEQPSMVAGFTGCPGFPCKFTYQNSVAGAPQSTTSNVNSVPIGYSGAPTVTVVGTSFISADRSGSAVTAAAKCLGGNNTYVTPTGPQQAALCPGGLPCTLWQLGTSVPVSPTDCGTESGPCYACRYEQRQFTWTRPTTTCNYSGLTYTYTVNKTAPSCSYSQSRWQLNRPRHRCTYQVGARRYDFAPPTEKVCEYWAVRSTIRSPRNLYTYEYLTSGTELIGRASVQTAGSILCGANGSATYTGALASACPADVVGCFPSMLNRSTSLGGGTGFVPPGSRCKLHWGGGDDATRVNGYPPYATAGGSACGSNRCLPGDICDSGICYSVSGTGGRYRYASYNSTFDANPGFSNSRLCQADDTSLPPSPDSYQVAKPSSATPQGFCSGDGVPSQPNYSLVSDYYDSTLANFLSTYTGPGCVPIPSGSGPPPQPGKPCFPTSNGPPASYSSVTWTQAPGGTVFNNLASFKVQGFGGRTGVSAPPSGDVPPVSTFVPIPDDSVYDEAVQASRLRAATNLCVMPSADVSPADGVQDGPNADGSLRGGACVADFADKSSGTAADFTPLFGSIKNAADYLLNRWSTDPEPQGRDCRDYFIILATDGQENTPAGFTLTGGSPTSSVEGLVTSIRNTSNVYPRTRPDIRTFVIGFGEGAAGAGVAPLNAVANAGGTTNAYFPSSLADLQNALNSVFTTILSGQESRSKPAIGSDGARIYAASYVKPAGTGPDWRGLFTAYQVDALTGAPSIAWDHHAKLNDPGHPARVIKAVVDDTTATQAVNLEPGMNWYGTPMNTHWEYGTSLPDGGAPDVADVINFLRFRNQPYDRLYGGSVVMRSSALGPIVNSSPVVVSKSPYDDSYGGSSVSSRTEFRTFVTSTIGRGTRVYFAANDGMIHSVIDGNDGGVCASETAIGCPNGREDWAVVPMNLRLGEVPPNGQPTLGQSLFKLKSTGSWNMNMLNGTVSIADVCNEAADFSASAENCIATNWKTVMIGSMREGGRGMIALDVTTHSPPNGSSASGSNGVLWHFHDGNLGLTYSAPAIGRVRFGGADKFVAFFGGGADDPGQAGLEGDSVFVVDALRRNVGVNGNPVLYANMGVYQVGGTQNIAFVDSIISRPATYRRPGSPYMDTGYISAGRTIYATRFAQPSGTQWDSVASWQPDEFFDPAGLRNEKQATNAAVNTTVNRVVRTYAGNPSNPNDPPVYQLFADGALPLPVSSAPPILNRAKLGNNLVASGKPDLYVGTGNTDSPNIPGPIFGDANYFYALHDFNEQLHGATNDGRALWVAKFCNGTAGLGAVGCTGTKEQVVSEPALISSCVIVATYTPSAAASCGATGDTTLYGFDAVTGALTRCLVYPPGSPWQGTDTSVLRLTGVGIPSDLVVINDSLYFSASNTPGVSQVGIRQKPRSGAVRSYRRLK
jgi:hypothetical protein